MTLISVFTLFCVLVIHGSLVNGIQSPVYCLVPHSFPAQVKVESRPYHSFAKDHFIPAVLTAIPDNVTQILEIANWAVTTGYRVRALGGNHNFSPFLFPQEEQAPCPKSILIDTSNFKDMKVISRDTSLGTVDVYVETGARLEELLEYLETKGYGFFSSPTVGTISVGGMLATGTHGTGIPFGNMDSTVPGQVHGTMSNMVVEMTLLAWDQETNQFQLRTLDRSHPDCKAFLIHLGRTIVTSVVIRVGKNQRLRSKSFFNITRMTALANPKGNMNADPNSLSNLVKNYGRVEFFRLINSIHLWILTYHNQERKPFESRMINRPYNYLFLSNIPDPVDTLLHEGSVLLPIAGGMSGELEYHLSMTGAKLLWEDDMWGWSKNHFLIVSNTTFHTSISAFVYLTSMDNLQQLLYIFDSSYQQLESKYAQRKQYPICGVLEYRFTGIDDPSNIGIPNAQVPLLSPSKPSLEHPEYNITVWIDLSSFYKTPGRTQLLTELQSLLYNLVTEDIALHRPEWSKEWAMSNDGPFTNETIIASFPTLFGRDGWNQAISAFNKYDPHKVFSNEFLDKVLVFG